MRRNNRSVQPPKRFDHGEGDRALPEPRQTKREMMDWRHLAHSAESEFLNERHQRTWNNWRRAVYRWYKTLQPYLEDFNSPSRDYSELRQIEKWMTQKQPGPKKLGEGDGNGITVDDVSQLQRYTQLLEYLMKDLGVTDIGLRQEKYEWGYEFLQGLPFTMSTENEGWRRLKHNIENMAELLREDTDFVVVITGPNRVGKDTLAVQLCDLGDPDFGMDNLIMNDEDFWSATDTLPPYSFIEVTELSDHFYSKDAMKGDQKKKKRKMKKYATENMCMIGCDVSWQSIDREFRNDKVSINIHVPKRGKFEFYPKDLVEQFEKDSDTGETIRPTPAFTGRFPKAAGADTVESLMAEYEDDREKLLEHLESKQDSEDTELKLWEMYVLKEKKKLDVEREEVEEDAITVPQLVREIKANQDRYTKPYGERTIVNKDLLKADFDGCNEDKARQAKAKAEADLGINQKES